MRQVRTRPIFSVRTRPLSSNTCRCWTTAARVMLSGLGEVRDRDGAFAELLHDPAASGVAEGVEDVMDGWLFAGHGLWLSEILFRFNVPVLAC